MDGNIVLACDAATSLPEALGHFLDKDTGSIYCLLSDRTQTEQFVNCIDKIYCGKYNKEMGTRVFFAYGDIVEERLVEKLREQIHQRIKNVCYLYSRQVEEREEDIGLRNMSEYAKECKASFHAVNI